MPRTRVRLCIRGSCRALACGLREFTKSVQFGSSSDTGPATRPRQRRRIPPRHKRPDSRATAPFAPCYPQLPQAGVGTAHRGPVHSSPSGHVPLCGDEWRPCGADSTPVAIDTHADSSQPPPPALLGGRPLLGSILLERGLLAPDRLAEALADPAPEIVEELRARLPYALRLVVTEPSLVETAWDDLLGGR